MILETERLRLRRLTADDRTALCAMLQDAEVMYAYAHAFDDAEVDDWLRRQLDRYARYGFGLWAVLRKETGALIGQCGVTMQETGEGEVPEIGYLLRKDCWHRGYATEAAAACRDYAFETLGFDRVWFDHPREQSAVAAGRAAAGNGSLRPDGQALLRHRHAAHPVLRPPWRGKRRSGGKRIKKGESIAFSLFCFICRNQLANSHVAVQT